MAQASLELFITLPSNQVVLIAFYINICMYILKAKDIVQNTGIASIKVNNKLVNSYFLVFNSLSILKY